MGMQGRSLYAFIGVQSCLIGLFPFYIPVYLYKASGSLAQICAFIAATGLGFVLCLYGWDRLSKQMPLNRLMILSLLCEWLLVSLFFLDNNNMFILLAGGINGFFNCSFWMIQRLLFLDTVTPENSGKKFGNFQIVVFLVLKTGIFAGGVLLDLSGYASVFLASTAIILVSGLFFIIQGRSYSLNPAILASPPLTVNAVSSFRDTMNSKPIFAVDGIFLYLESYFWMISLFLIVRQSFAKFGILVIFLAGFFGLFFWIIKNSIDRIPGNIMYQWAVVLYAASWGLRGMIHDLDQPLLVFIFLAVITFCTSFFRLAFNKRFFDIAKSTTGHEYVYIKSYLSQLFLALAAVAGMFLPDVDRTLPAIYFWVAPLSFVYLFYHAYPCVRNAVSARQKQ